MCKYADVRMRQETDFLQTGVDENMQMCKCEDVQIRMMVRMLKYKNVQMASLTICTSAHHLICTSTYSIC